MCSKYPKYVKIIKYFEKSGKLLIIVEIISLLQIRQP
jgi:hypothetical protein